MEVTNRTVDQITVIEMSGELDGKTSPIAQEKISPLCTNAVRIALDMSKVEFMSSAGLRLMLSIYRRISGVQGHIVLVGLSEELADTMSATGFLDYFKTFATLEEGLKALKEL